MEFLMKKILLFFTFLFTIIFCDSSKLPNDVRWVVSSKEYKQLCEQVYDHAQYVCMMKSKFYKSNTMFKTPAIVMDLDETVLDNSQYQVELYEKNETYGI